MPRGLWDENNILLATEDQSLAKEIKRYLENHYYSYIPGRDLIDIVTIAGKDDHYIGKHHK